MSPHDIDFLLWCYTRPNVYPTISSLSARDTLTRFLADGLIADVGDDLYETTARGEAHIKQLLSLDLPTQAWVDSNGKIIG